MTTIEIIECDTCGKKLTHGNSYKEAGWITIEGTMTTATGKYYEAYQTLWIQGDKTHHFCSAPCLLGHNDNYPKNGHGVKCPAINVLVHWGYDKDDKTMPVCTETCYEVCEQKKQCTWYGKYVIGSSKFQIKKSNKSKPGEKHASKSKNNRR